MSTKHNGHIRYLLFALVPAVLIAMVVLPAVLSAAPPANPGNASLANARQCAKCHDDTTLITGRRAGWSTSLHATGTAFLRGTSASCAGCHSGGGFSLRVAEGLAPDEVTQGDPHPTRQECRTCHQIHVTYTEGDWALETTAPVDLFAIEGKTFDKGKGNLCANCHQPRRAFPEAVGGVISGITEHWGPHHGPQSAMMLGTAGSIEGSPADHYMDNNVLADGCVSCHMEPNGRHTFAPDVSVCRNCHTGATNFDINGFQSQTRARLDAIGAELVALGVLSSNDEDGHPTVTSAPENVATALYNWLYIAHEDKSLGVHNPDYTSQLLFASCSALGITCP
jgi:hypothetical protein